MEFNTFADYKKFLKEYNKFYAYKAVVVSEVESLLSYSDINMELTEDDYETVCDFIYDLALDIPDLSITVIAGTLIYYLANEPEYTVDDLKNNSIDVRNFILENI